MKTVILCINTETCFSDHPDRLDDLGYVPVAAARVADRVACDLGIRTEYDAEFRAWHGGRIDQFARRCGLAATLDRTVTDSELEAISDAYHAALAAEAIVALAD